MFETIDSKTVKVKSMKDIQDYLAFIGFDNNTCLIKSYARYKDAGATLTHENNAASFSSHSIIGKHEFVNNHIESSEGDWNQMFYGAHQIIFHRSVFFYVWFTENVFTISPVLAIPNCMNYRCGFDHIPLVPHSIELEYTDSAYEQLKSIFGVAFEMPEHQIILA